MDGPLHGMKLLFAGSGAFGVPTLRRLVAGGADLRHVYTQPSRPAGRGRKLTPTPIADVASALKLALTETERLNALVPLEPVDALVVIAFGQKLSDSVVKAPRFGAINLHASRLPRHRGAAPIHWAVMSGEATTGNSVIRLANVMDAGAVLAMSETPIGESETTGELHDRLAIDGADLVERVLIDLRNGRAIENEQDHSLATLAPKLSRESAQIDWSRDAAAIARQINGLSPWPGCRVRVLDGEREVDRMTLLRARPTASIGATPGTAGEAGRLSCGTGAVELLDVQADGRRGQPMAQYLVGGRWKPGLRLESI